MKIPVLILCFVILTLSLNTASADLRAFGESIRSVAHKAGEDIRGLFGIHKPPRKNEVTTDSAIHFPDEEPTTRSTTTSSTTTTTEASTSVTTSAAVTSTTKKSTDANIETTTQQITTTSSAANSNKTTTEKDGRENFQGGCAAGFQRTNDGRCKEAY